MGEHILNPLAIAKGARPARTPDWQFQYIVVTEREPNVETMEAMKQLAEQAKANAEPPPQVQVPADQWDIVGRLVLQVIRPSALTDQAEVLGIPIQVLHRMPAMAAIGAFEHAKRGQGGNLPE